MIIMGIVYLLGSLICAFVALKSTVQVAVTQWTPSNVWIELGFSVLAVGTIIGCGYWLIEGLALVIP